MITSDPKPVVLTASKQKDSLHNNHSYKNLSIDPMKFEGVRAKTSTIICPNCSQDHHIKDCSNLCSLCPKSIKSHTYWSRPCAICAKTLTPTNTQPIKASSPKKKQPAKEKVKHLNSSSDEASSSD